MIEQVRHLDEFRRIVDSHYRTHYMLEFRNSMDGGKMTLIFRLQGLSKPYYVGDEPKVHIVEYSEVLSVSWNDREVLELLEKNPGMKTTEAMAKVLEEWAKEYVKIAEKFSATEGQYVLR